MHLRVTAWSLSAKDVQCSKITSIPTYHPATLSVPRIVANSSLHENAPATPLRMPSPFFSPDPVSTPSTLALLHLKRDLITPIILESPTDSSEKIENTRFGSYPHSTLLNKPWGSQVLASKVDTGSRGRGKGGKKLGKRKRDDEDEIGTDADLGFVNLGEKASSGFAHLILPTPETWTIGLPHRTQVVYTPDYSYILQKLRVRPGDRILEAGAGSGSFTHAAARAVFNGYPSKRNEGVADDTVHDQQKLNGVKKTKKPYGKVFSFEYHEPRFQKLQQEIVEHGLEGVVRVTHRDVYNNGFCVPPDDFTEINGQEPSVNAIFLDLPAPWLALPHLTRESQNGANALNPTRSVRICTFSPCIEQVTKTVSTLRELGWVDVEMSEVEHRRIDIVREKVGLGYEGLRGVNATAKNVEEAIARLREVEGRSSRWIAESKEAENGDSTPGTKRGEKGTKGTVKAQRLEGIRQAAETGEIKMWREGRLIHRTEQELKTHTSYLVFAVLPITWTQEDEEKARQIWDKPKASPGSNGAKAT